MATINDIGNNLVVIILGTDGQTKANEISEKFQTAFDPPPSFLENHIVLHAQKALFKVKKSAI